MTNDERDRLLTRLETLLIDMLMPTIKTLDGRVNHLEHKQGKQSGAASWRGAAIRNTLMILGLAASLTLGILALIYR